MKRSQQFFRNALILTVTSALMSAVGIWFNLYVSNRLGPDGTGIFQLISSVYSFAVTLATSGIHLAVTRLVAQEMALKQEGGVRRSLMAALAYAVFFGLLSGLLLFTFAPQISQRWISGTIAIRTLRIMAFTLPLLSISSVLSGYFTAVRRVYKNAAAQILEHAIKIPLIMAMLTLAIGKDLESACLAIAWSGIIAEVITLLFQLILFYLERRGAAAAKKSPSMLKPLLGIALPVATSSYLRSGLGTIKNLLVPIRLQVGGLSQIQAFSVFGIVQGVVLPVILFPWNLIGSFAGLIVPEVAELNSLGRDVGRIISRLIRLTLLFAIGTCGIIFIFASEIGAAASSNPDVPVFIRLIAPIIPIMYLDTIVDSMLKGLGEQLCVMRYNVYEAVLSVVAVYLVLPIFGIKGYILIICLCELFNFTLSFLRLSAVAKFELDLVETIVKPILCVSVAALLAQMVCYLSFFAALSATLQAGVLIAISIFFYLLLSYFCGFHKLLFSASAS